jgi:DNA polymerase-3 subunit beta
VTTDKVRLRPFLHETADEVVELWARIRLIEGSQAELIFDSPEAGEGRELLLVEMVKGDPKKVLPLEVSYNARYLIEPLNAMAGETVLLEINDAERPARLQDPSDPRYISIVMPLSK